MKQHAQTATLRIYSLLYFKIYINKYTNKLILSTHTCINRGGTSMQFQYNQQINYNQMIC